MGDHPLCKWLYSFHIPMFFVISGILLSIRNAYDSLPLRRVFAHRIKALFYPYMTFSFLTFLYNVLRGNSAHMARIIRYTLTLEGYNTLWFIPAMLLAECLFFILRRSRLKDGLCVTLIFLGTSVYAALQFYALGGGEPAEAGLLYQILNGFCRAGMGYLFIMAGFQGAKLAARFAQTDKRRCIAIALLAFGVGAVLGMANGLTDYHYSIIHNPLLSYPAALLQAGALIALCKLCVRHCTVLEYFGKNSLIVMATHYSFPLLNTASLLVGLVCSGIRYIDTVLVCTLTLLFEVPIIALIRHAMPFMLKWPEQVKSRQ